MNKPCNLVEVIRRETAEAREAVAVVDGGRELTYGQLLAAVEAVAGALRRAGIRPLHRVAFLCEDSADYIIGSLAILAVPAVVVPLSPSLMGDELERVMERMDVHHLLYDAAVLRRDDGRPVDTDAFPSKQVLLVSRQARDDFPAEYTRLNPAFIRFSSGTTGDSKGVLLSHETIMDRTDAADRGLRITRQDTVIWVLAMSFHFVVTILLFQRRGATIVICRQPFPESFLAAAGTRRATFFYASPFHYHVLATSALVPPAGLAGVRLAVSTAMKLPEETAAAFAVKFGFELAEAYGIIEVGLPFLNAGTGARPRGAVGRALPDYEIRVTGADDQGVGAIEICGKGMFDAYVSPWRTRREVFPDGWFRTGDIGRLDAEGRLFILGREKNVINFVGMKIFPYEVEAVIAGHEAVRECLVYGEPHSLYGQMPAVKIVLKDGARPPPLEDLRRYCFQRLASHKVPKTFHFVERLERTESGKIKRV